jgi:hypothetical protein
MGFLPLRHTTVAMATSNVIPGFLLIMIGCVFCEGRAELYNAVYVCCVEKGMRLNTQLSFENIIQNITNRWQQCDDIKTWFEL